MILFPRKLVLAAKKFRSKKYKPSYLSKSE